MLERMNGAVVGMQASGIRRVTAMANATEGCISLALGEPSFDTPEAIREATKRALDSGQTHYPPNMGLPALRQAIAEHESQKSGEPVTADQVVVTCGSTEALACAILGIVEPGDEVIVPVPAFGLYQQQLQIARGVCVRMPTEAAGFQLDAALLESCITPRTKALLLNSPNNPTGVVYSQESLDVAVSACLRHNLFLIYDAVYDRLAYVEHLPTPSAGVLGERLIRCNAFSKTYAMTGWRIGYCVAAPAVAAQLCKAHAALTVGVSTFSQAGCVRIFDVNTDWMREAYRENRDMTYARLTQMGLPVVKPEGAFYAFAPIQSFGLSDEAFTDRLIHEAGVAMVPGSCFDTPGYVRISYCCGRDTLAEGLDRFARFIALL